MLDSLVIGAGPAGITAATYLARFRRDVAVIDAGRSRARYIPVSRNTPGFPGGVNGQTLLAELREQAARFGVEAQRGIVERLRRDGDGFVAETTLGQVRSRTIVLATGIEDVLPPIEGVEEAILRSVVRLCAVCDGYEADACRVAVYGPPERAESHARYMRTFTTEVSLVSSDAEVPAATRRRLEPLGIRCIDGVRELRWDGGDEVEVEATGGHAAFDAFYPVLGARTRSQLALELGAGCTEEASLVVDEHQQTTIAGLYAAGDVVSALNQISVGYGHAAIAATDIHNRLPHRPREARGPGSGVRPRSSGRPG